MLVRLPHLQFLPCSERLLLINMTALVCPREIEDQPSHLLKRTQVRWEKIGIGRYELPPQSPPHIINVFLRYVFRFFLAITVSGQGVSLPILSICERRSSQNPGYRQHDTSQEQMCYPF